MTTKKIRLDDAGYTISTTAPDYVEGASGFKVSIYDLAGAVLVDSDDADCGASDTLSSATYAGGETLVITAAALSYVPKSGDHFRVGSSSFGWQNLTVKHYVSGTKTITTEEYISDAFPSGSAVEWLDVSYEIDTTGTEWDNLDSVSVIWEPQGIDALPWTETFEVLLRSAAVSALEANFRTAYPRYHDAISKGSFDSYRARAEQRLRTYFESKQRAFSKIVDSELLREPMMAMIAILIALASSDRMSTELETLQKDLTAQLSLLDSMPMWIDDNQDMIETEEETQMVTEFGIARIL